MFLLLLTLPVYAEAPIQNARMSDLTVGIMLVGYIATLSLSARAGIEIRNRVKAFVGKLLVSNNGPTIV
jgi:hypothetical protein